MLKSDNFPCLNNTAPGITCEIHYDATPGKVGYWYQISSIQLPSFGLRCYPEIIVTNYRLKHLHTLDLSGTDNHIDIDTLRLFLLPSVPNIQHLDVGYAITNARTSLQEDDTTPWRRTLIHGTFSICNNLLSLRYIDLTNANMEDSLLDAECMNSLVELKTLYLDGNNISMTECKQGLASMNRSETSAKLEKIRIGRNPLLSNIAECFKISTLQELSMTDSTSMVGAFPSDLCAASASLITLDLSGSLHLTSLPNCLSTMSKLKTLYVKLNLCFWLSIYIP